jgi:hypothetical protein
MRKSAVSVLSILCLFAGLAVSAGTAVAQNPNLHPIVTLTPESLFFSVRAGQSATAPVVLSNHSGVTLNISKIEIDETCSTTSNCGTQFHVVSHGCGAALRNGSSCTINVEFTPAADVETAQAGLKVTFSGVSVTQTKRVALTGESRL